MLCWLHNSKALQALHQRVQCKKNQNWDGAGLPPKISTCYFVSNVSKWQSALFASHFKLTTTSDFLTMLHKRSAFILRFIHLQTHIYFVSFKFIGVARWHVRFLFNWKWLTLIFRFPHAIFPDRRQKPGCRFVFVPIFKWLTLFFFLPTPHPS